VKEAGEFVWNLATMAQAAAMNATSATVNSTGNQRRSQTGSMAGDRRSCGIHINRAMLEDGIYQTARPHPITRGGPADYFEVTEEHLFKMKRPD
jgi:hypothetical protein